VPKYQNAAEQCSSHQYTTHWETAEWNVSLFRSDESCVLREVSTDHFVLRKIHGASTKMYRGIVEIYCLVVSFK